MLYGGSGNDLYVVNNPDTVINENPGEGDDTVWSTVNYTLAANVENLYLVGAVNGIGNNEANLISGYFGSNNHLISGLDGNDTLIGGTALDELRGGADDDIYGVYNSDTVIIENADQGTDTVWSAVNYTLTANVENLYLVGNANGTGNEGNNTIVGYGEGNNIIEGGAGDDFLAGGTGTDTFVLRDPLQDGIDTISDFEVNVDKFNLASINYGDDAVGVLATGRFTVGATATDADHRIIYDNNSGALYFDADGSGLALQVQIAQLKTNLSLTNTSFSLV
jgi:serralysin